MLKRIILIVLGLSLVIFGCSTPDGRLGAVNGNFGGKILYRQYSESNGVEEIFIVKKGDNIYMVEVSGEGNFNEKSTVHLALLKTIDYQEPQNQKLNETTRTIIKEVPTSTNILCVDDKSGILVNGTIYYLGKKSSYDETVLQPTRCFK